MFYSDGKMVKEHIGKAVEMMEAGGDWDRRNRLKAYRARHCCSVRDFKMASELFLQTVSTFTSTELMDYKTLVELTTLVSVLTLPRTELRDKVMQGPEVQEVLHQSPMFKRYLEAFYNCNYADFFVALAEVEVYMQGSSILAPHCEYYVREMRIKAYIQLLESYRSVTIASMAESFGVTEAFIDRELSRFVAAGRLNCKIDKVGGVVVTTRPDAKSAQYLSVITQGDLLLNRVQKLSQVINIE